MMRSHRCGDLNKAHLATQVTLCGWVHTRRDHGHLIFIDLKDRYGITQIIFDPQIDPLSHEKAQTLRSEYVIQITGAVRERQKGQTNTQRSTGEIEVEGKDLTILSSSLPLPFALDDNTNASEVLKLKYRYLDLRRSPMQKNLMIRHQILQFVRRFLSDKDFLEIETPILYKSTPEGARDFLVPSRISPGSFYALPQSPQILKQLLMISGMDRYFQLARCFRDEDFRADRQPEFSQLDIEMAFVQEEDLLNLIEKLIKALWNHLGKPCTQKPFLRLHYDEALSRFGSDKPDLRFELEIQNITDVFSHSEFIPFQKAQQGFIGALVIRKEQYTFSRKQLDQVNEVLKAYDSQALWVKVQEQALFQSASQKAFSEKERQMLIQKLSLKPQDTFFVIAQPEKKRAYEALGALRLHLGATAELLSPKNPEESCFLWVTHFPLLEHDTQNNRYTACHHPFTSPRPDQEKDFLEQKNLHQIKAAAYDLVLNGMEIGGGSIRIHNPEVQKAMFQVLNLSEEDTQEKFGFFLEALQYGTPPHGGIALGIDRITAILCNVSAIRDVMAFPKTAKGHCLMSSCPSSVSQEQLDELKIKGQT